MAFVQESLIWVTYAIAIAILFIIASTFIYIYQKPRDRAVAVTTVCIFTTLALLATVLLIPIDVALVSSTSRSSLGRKKDWATPEKVASILFTLRVVYYTLYSLDALLCLLVIPFIYFWYEEYDEDAAESGEQTAGQRLLGALKYTAAFLMFIVIIFLVGFFVPFSKHARDNDRLDFDYFKRLLAENHGERALSFGLGFLITIGTVLYALYTGAGMALLPVAMIKSAPAISAPDLAANTASQLENNRERQRQLEGRNEGRDGGLNARDRRELESLIREERTLIRRERLAAESSGEDRHQIIKAWIKVEAFFRPLKLIGGFLLIICALLIFASMLITGIDKAKNSICGAHCGYILGHINIFQPVNWILVKSSKVFPIDYILFLLLVLFFFSASVVGVAAAGIRFLWITIFRIRKGQTSPQALLMATVLLTLIVLAINYSVAMVVAPQYATWGPQTYCDLMTNSADEQPDCSEHKELVRKCSELATNPSAKDVCTPSVLSTFLNRVTLNFPFFGAVLFWAQFAFLGVYLVVFTTTLFRVPQFDQEEIDRDLEEEEEEGLLASTGRRFGAAWSDATGAAKSSSYGTTNGSSSERTGSSAR